MFPVEGPTEFEISVDRATVDELPFYCISIAKLCLLSVASLGLYEFYWFYKNWQLVQARTGSDISPFWRAFFSPFYCHSLASAVDSAAESVEVVQRTRPNLIAGVYLLTFVTQRFPDPYWLLGALSFVPLIPIVRQIRAVHDAIRPGFDSEVGWGGWSFATLVVGAPVAAFVVAIAFGPPTHALEQSEIRPSLRATLVEAEIVEPDEEIEFLYSPGLFSVLENGNLMTPTRVVAWETWEGERFLFGAHFVDIRDIDVAYSNSFLVDTTISVATWGGREFVMVVSNEKGRDREFVERLESHLPYRP